MKTFTSALLVACLSAASVLCAQQAIPTLSSPNGQLQMSFAITPAKGAPANGGGQLTYAVTYHGKAILEASPMGLLLDDETPLGKDVTVKEAKAGSGVDDYDLPHSKFSHVKDAYNSVTITVAEPGNSGRTLIVEARAYDAGVAFRYVVPQQAALSTLRVRGEATKFNFAEDDPIWALELPNYRSSYEAEYLPLTISALGNQGGVTSHILVGMPLLLHQPGVAWMSLMESDLEGNSSMYVTNSDGGWIGHELNVLLSPRWDDDKVAVTGTLPHHSAWRVLSVADTPGALAESNVVTDLSPANRLTDTSWIKPGKASWNWWSDNIDNEGRSGNDNFTTATMKEYVDFAAQSGFPYFFLDAGWSKQHDITQMNGRVDIPALVKYAAKKNVKVWIWLYSTESKDQMKEAFPLYEKWGVAGLKIDFVNRDDQEGIQWFYDTAREAAKYHLMVDFHGCHTPWGILRTYPNVMSYEGILGMEQNKAGRRDTVVERARYPFTRMLAGPLDYTAGGFENVTEDQFKQQNTAPMVMGTRAEQLALYVVYENPVPMVSDAPIHYKGQASFQFLKDVPVVWDETHFLNGYPGQYATVARRSGTEWDLGSITDWTPRTLEVPLKFLGPGSYTAEIYADGPNADTDPKEVIISKQTVTADSVLTLKLAPGGGAAVRMTPIDNGQ
ncbi:MAG: glycoside hydrolase family 97 protein [Acidobacteriota bacterium]|nr:glycoside hydrolase family 97 protein [Acidobacteriota bacterium]